MLKNLTTRYLTPLLSQREFGHLRDNSTMQKLQDESLQIKVALNTSEVIATYTVDEYPLEIAITMPNDYPLRPVEVRDIRKVGISEGTWRAWILGMRQLIAGRNGLVYDGKSYIFILCDLMISSALLLFKRNVEAMFSGYDEDSTCAICYSIVSPTDHSLPTKPCKTCKKKFHTSVSWRLAGVDLSDLFISVCTNGYPPLDLPLVLCAAPYCDARKMPHLSCYQYSPSLQLHQYRYI